MKTLGEILKSERKKRSLILRKVSAEVDIDQSLISKFEKNERKPTKEQLIRLAIFFDLCKKELLIKWHSDRVVEELKYADSSIEILKAAEIKLKYYKTQENGK